MTSISVFVLALIGFLILNAAMLLSAGFMDPGEVRETVLNMLCGCVYLIGSIIVLAVAQKTSIAAMAAAGLILNMIGAVFWVPTIGSRDYGFAIIGIILGILWLYCVFLKIFDNKANRSHHPT